MSNAQFSKLLKLVSNYDTTWNSTLIYLTQSTGQYCCFGYLAVVLWLLKCSEIDEDECFGEQGPDIV